MPTTQDKKTKKAKEVATVQPTQVVRPPLNLKLNMAATKKVANDLAQFVKENNLSANIAGKNYMLVEGWEFAGSQLGLVSIVKNVIDESPEDHSYIKYKAIVDIKHLRTGEVVSKGWAICSSKESKKKSFEDYAIYSMAQTRAIGKGYRNILAWLVKSAGFEPTPKEEVNSEQMEADLGKAKQKVFVALKEHGMTDSVLMVDAIHNAIGKDVIETIDGAYKVLDYLDRLDESEEGSV